VPAALSDMIQAAALILFVAAAAISSYRLERRRHVV